MTIEEARNLAFGAYRVFWKEECGGGYSIGTVGQKYDGRRWLCCTNWTSDMHQRTDSCSEEVWAAVDRLELIAES